MTARDDYWEERYAAAQAWSGKVNPTLESVAAALEPARALELACGEGADALWLAERGWVVEAIDGSSRAIARASEAARERGVRVALVHRDLTRWRPTEAWDLVACHFLHESPEVRAPVFAAARDAVAPGGTLLIVGHHPDEAADVPGPPRSARFTASEVSESLDLQSRGWSVKLEDRPRSAIKDGAEHLRLDTVLIARRPSS